MDTSELIGRIYESVDDPEAFAGTVDAMRIATGSRAVQSALIETNGSWVQATLIGLDPTILKTYVDYYASDDPRMRYSLRHPGMLVPCHAAVSDESAFERSPLVNELLDKGGVRFAMATMFPVDTAHSILLCFMRARKDGRYGTDEIDGLFPVLPHLKRALALNIRLGRFESRLGSLTALVDRLAAPILLTDGAGVLLYANAPGQAELRTGSYLALRNGRIEPREPRRLRRFAELVAAASAGNPILEASDPSGSMRLLDVEGKTAVLVVQGLRGQPRESSMPSAAVALFLNSAIGKDAKRHHALARNIRADARRSEARGEAHPWRQPRRDRRALLRGSARP